MNRELFDAIDSGREEILSELSNLIAIPSESGDLKQVGKALDYALDLGRRLGLRAYTEADGQVGVIEMGPEVGGADAEILGILTHVDVVPAGDERDWNTPPYEMTIKDGICYGRGTLDDKGMLIASLYAMKAVKDTGKKQYKTTRLIIGTQEEVEWVDMDAYVSSCRLPDYGFTPDGEYPICNIEKGCFDLTVEFDVREEAAPEGVYVKSCDIGSARNMVPGRAACTLSDGTVVEASGRAVHSCQPEKGDNAIFRLVDELEAMDLADCKFMQVLRGIRRDLADYEGRGVGIFLEDEYYEGEFVHRNAMSPTILSCDGQTAKLNIDIRFPYGESEERLEQKIADWAGIFGGKVTHTDCMPAVFVSKEKPYLKVFAKAYEEVTGLNNEFTLAYGGSYAKAMPNIVSWGPIFPGDEDTCHEANEFISFDTLFQSAKIFAQSIEEIVTEEKSFRT